MKPKTLLKKRCRGELLSSTQHEVQGSSRGSSSELKLSGAEDKLDGLLPALSGQSSPTPNDDGLLSTTAAQLLVVVDKLEEHHAG